MMRLTAILLNREAGGRRLMRKLKLLRCVKVPPGIGNGDGSVPARKRVVRRPRVLNLVASAPDQPLAFSARTLTVMLGQRLEV